MSSNIFLFYFFHEKRNLQRQMKPGFKIGRVNGKDDTFILTFCPTYNILKLLLQYSETCFCVEMEGYSNKCSVVTFLLLIAHYLSFTPQTIRLHSLTLRCVKQKVINYSIVSYQYRLKHVHSYARLRPLYYGLSGSAGRAEFSITVSVLTHSMTIM